VDFDKLAGKYRVRYKKRNYGYFKTFDEAVAARKAIENPALQIVAA